MPAENTCVVRVGRLMEIDVAAGYNTIPDVDAMIDLIKAEMAQVARNVRVVIAADWRACHVLTPEVADRAVAMLSGVNPRVQRSAILHRADQPVSVLQVLRLVKESHNENRKVFTSPHEMEAWLGEVLQVREQARLGVFLRQRT